MEIIIGTKAWSSWSMRPWLALKRTGAPFTETLIQLRQENERSAAQILAHSPSGLVPALKDGDVTIWDSLAICEYLAEKFPQAALWPADPVDRALARSAAAEMHSGFAALRSECPMALDAPSQTAELSEATLQNVRRILGLWSQLLTRSGGPFLVGGWSIADAFYTPVAVRLRDYGIQPADHGASDAVAAYGARLLNTAEFLEWEKAARS